MHFEGFLELVNKSYPAYSRKLYAPISVSWSRRGIQQFEPNVVFRTVGHWVVEIVEKCAHPEYSHVGSIDDNARMAEASFAVRIILLRVHISNTTLCRMSCRTSLWPQQKAKSAEREICSADGAGGYKGIRGEENVHSASCTLIEAVSNDENFSTSILIEACKQKWVLKNYEFSEWEYF